MLSSPALPVESWVETGLAELALVRDSLTSCGWPQALQETLYSPTSLLCLLGISQLATASGSQDVCRKG